MQNEAPISLITIIRDIEDPREERTRLHTLENLRAVLHLVFDVESGIVWGRGLPHFPDDFQPSLAETM